MSPTTLTIVIALVAAIPSSLAAILGILILSKSGQIHHLVNSAFTRVQADLQIALTRIQLLEAYIAKAGGGLVDRP